MAAITILTNTVNLNVPEGGTAKVWTKLKSRPAATTSVSVTRTSGDTHLSVASGATLTFTAANWNTSQVVTFAAASDADTANNQAIFKLSGSGCADRFVTVTSVEPATSASARVVIDPVTRIEGHLRVEVKVEGGKVTDAWSTATLFRGIETILQNRDPRDAPMITQRLCGVCTHIHSLCSVRAIEDAVNVTVSRPARLVRNLLEGAQWLHDHPVHLYHLSALDWVDIVSALSADPAKTKALADPRAPAMDFAATQARLQAFVATGQLGPFANAYWGHSAYKCTPEENLLLATHYLEALKRQIRTARMQAILGGKNPHPQTEVVGGVTVSSELTAARLADFSAILAETRQFVETVYIPDVLLLARRYPEWASIGGSRNFLAYGEFPEGDVEPASLYLPRGAIFDGRVAGVQDVDEALISEHVAHSWYQGATARHPTAGETVPAYTGLDQNARYSWLKAPRYNGRPMEVGPLARVLVAYGRGHKEVVPAVNGVFSALGLKSPALFSALGRIAARAIETKVVGLAMARWVAELEGALASGDREVMKMYTMPSVGSGVGLNEAPRGAVGHWLRLSGGKIGNYQMVVPSAWNFGPRDAAGVAGTVEQALLGVPVADPGKPVEVLRVLHSFDPCIACGVHVVDGQGAEVTSVRVI